MDGSAPPQPQPTYTQAWVVGMWATGASVGLFFTGVMAMLSFHPMCILVGMYIVFMSMVTAVIEAPLIYRISEFTQGLHARFDGVKCWQKGVFYTASIVPVFLCIEFTTILSILFLTGNAVGYIFLAMSTRRQGLSVRSDGGESGLSTTTDDPLLTS